MAAMKVHALVFLLSTVYLAELPTVVGAQFIYSTNNGGLTLIGYNGPGGDITIPDSAGGLPVTRIGNDAFWWDRTLTNLTIPDSVTVIEGGGWVTDMTEGHYIGAFYNCGNLTNVNFGNNIREIGSLAFHGCAGLTKVALPASVASIGGGSRLDRDLRSVVYLGAFTDCVRLEGVWCKGNAPWSDGPVFDGDNFATVYYLPGSSNWSTIFAGRPTAVWQPQVQTTGKSFGVQTNQFGFNVAWASGQVIVVEACADPANPNWSALQTNSLTSSTFYFSDPDWSNFPTRFYRIRSP